MAMDNLKRTRVACAPGAIRVRQTFAPDAPYDYRDHMMQKGVRGMSYYF